jgi:hypothetical protein
VRDKKK